MLAEGLDLGHGVAVDFVFEGGDGTPLGLVLRHAGAGGQPCFDNVAFDVPEAHQFYQGPSQPYWTVESLEPLTIAPSILCGTCGHHGFIRSGQWVPA